MAGENLSEPVQYVRHASLERVSDESAYRVVCTACDMGLMLVKRVVFNDDGFATAGIWEDVFREMAKEMGVTSVLLREDRCQSCGQRYCYTDDEINGELLIPELSEDGKVIKAIDDCCRVRPSRYEVLSGRDED